MFNWSVTAPGACDPYFLECMFEYGRRDISADGQRVFETICAYGDPRHIEVFMKRHKEHNWNLFKGMKSAVNQDNRTNFHHLLMYVSVSGEEISKLWNVACGEYRHGTEVFTYMQYFYKCEITKEQLIKCIIHRFHDTLEPLIKQYLQSNEPFDIDKNIVNKIIKTTEDRLDELELLNNLGFKIKGYQEIKDAKLPRASTTRYIKIPY